MLDLMFASGTSESTRGLSLDCRNEDARNLHVNLPGAGRLL